MGNACSPMGLQESRCKQLLCCKQLTWLSFQAVLYAFTLVGKLARMTCAFAGCV